MFLLPFSASRDQSLPACMAPRGMQPTGLEGPRVLSRQPLLRLLLLLLLLPWPVTRAQAVPGASSDPTVLGPTSAPTRPGTPSIRSTQERVQALMRAFPLVDGCVDAVWGPEGAELTLRQSRGPDHEGLVRRLLHATLGNTLSTITHGLPSPHYYSIPGGTVPPKLNLWRSPCHLREVGRRGGTG